MNNLVTPQKVFTQAEKDAFMNALMSAGTSLSEKAAGSVPSPYYGHGPGGVFSLSEQTIINASILPIGIQSRLPVRFSNSFTHMVSIFTGQTDSSGTEPTEACADAPQPGNLKMCNQVWGFGRLIRDSQVLQADKAGTVNNSREFTNFNVLGNPFTNLERPAVISFEEGMRSEAGKKLLELYNSWLLDFSHLLYDGNPANTAGSAGYIEYNGFDRMINTGYQDAFIQQACPAADSTIVNFGSSPITGNETQIVTDIVETLAYLEHLSFQTGLNPVEWVLAMRWEVFRQLSSVWPCVYMTYRCTFGSTANAQVNVSANDQVAMRDNMRNGQYGGNDAGSPYLLIDGKAVKVVIDDNITETVPAANVFMSDIYFIPLTIRGGRPVTYMEYFDLNTPGGMRDATQAMAPEGSFQIIGGGRYWLHRKPPTNECIQVRLGAKPRLIMETPFLAARLTNVKYSPPLFHARAAFPDSPYYFSNGGGTTMTAPTFYSPTA